MTRVEQDRLTKLQVDTDVEAVPLWSVACATRLHVGCVARLGFVGVLVVCPCSCHGEAVHGG